MENDCNIGKIATCKNVRATSAHPHIRKSEFVLPHHALHRLVALVAVLGIGLFVIGHFDGSVYGEVNELADRHARIYAHRLLYGDLQRPVPAETNVALAGSGMYVDAEAAGGRLSFEERNVCVCVG